MTIDMKILFQSVAVVFCLMSRIDCVHAENNVVNVQVGIASWYSQTDGKTSSGIPFDPKSNMAAHKTLPLGTVVRVINLDNNKSETVWIADRGPYVAGRIIDLSPATAHQLGVADKGLLHVKLVPITPQDAQYEEVAQQQGITKEKIKDAEKRSVSHSPLHVSSNKKPSVSLIDYDFLNKNLDKLHQVDKIDLKYSTVNSENLKSHH